MVFHQNMESKPNTFTDLIYQSLHSPTTKREEISLDLGDSSDQGESRSPQTSAGEEMDSLFLVIELGLKKGEAVAPILSSSQDVSRLRGKTEEWIDTDEFLWSPSGQ